jgi:AraC-like DNA-binding protein
MNFNVMSIPEHLKPYVECIRTVEHPTEPNMAINVCLNGLPGIVFQHCDGYSPIASITTRSWILNSAPTLYVYGQMTEPGIMNHKPTPFTSIQIVLKPHTLHSLLGLNASALTNSVVDLAEMSAGDLNSRLFDSEHAQDSVSLLIDYLSMKLQQVKTRDELVEESLRIIHHNPARITVRELLERLNISERQFEKRFSQTVGIPPHFYIRIRRFNEAIRLMKTRRFDTLTDVAHRLNFYDQSHFIRDIKAFSGVTPKSLSQKIADIALDQRVMAYV